MLEFQSLHILVLDNSQLPLYDKRQRTTHKKLYQNFKWLGLAKLPCSLCYSMSISNVQVMQKPEEGLFLPSDALLKKSHILEYNSLPLKKFVSWNPAMGTTSWLDLFFWTSEFLGSSSCPASWFSSTDFDSGDRLLLEV